MALNKFFRFPFAVTGDKAAIPDDTQLSGDVSFEQGYGPDYARDPATDPFAKNIERDRMNQLFFDVTTALREYQIMGTPDFITSAQNGGTAFQYSKWARVRYNDGTGFKIYESKIDTNTDLPTVSASWAQVSSFDFASFLATQVEAVAGTDNTKYMSPLRVSQAVPSATESTAGRLQIATAAQAQSLVNDTTALTPAKLAAALMGGNAKAATPPQFDNDTSLATTAFVQRALGNFAGRLAASVSQTLPTSAAGNIVSTYGSGITLTLPLSASVPAGSVICFENDGPDITIATQGGDYISTSSTTPTSMVLKSGDTLQIESNFFGAWRVIGGSGQLPYSILFGSLKAASGYQKLPSGLIIQWGKFTTSTSGKTNLTFPIAFPTSVRSVTASPDYTLIGATAFINFDFIGATTSTIPVWARDATNVYTIATPLSYIATGY